MEYNSNFMKQAEAQAANGDISGMYSTLRKITLADFCALSAHVPAIYPALAKVLPSMPDDEVQKRWVGDFGRTLLTRSCSLARLFDLISWRVTGSGLSSKRILDYGCGWGRLLRVMSYYSDPSDVYGIDAMQISIDLCKSHGVSNPLSLIQARPTKDDTPFGQGIFDFSYLFSVFSHTPREVTSSILKNLHLQLAKGGIIVCTIRTIEWLTVRNSVWPKELLEDLHHSYNNTGYAFAAMNGDGSALAKSDYGDTIMTPAYFGQLAKESGWKIADLDRDVLEPFQICVTLMKE